MSQANGSIYLVIVFPNYDCILSQLKYTVNGLTANTMVEHAIRIRPTKKKIRSQKVDIEKMSSVFEGSVDSFSDFISNQVPVIFN